MNDETRRQTLLDMIVDAVCASTQAIGDEVTALRIMRAEAFLEAGLELELFDAEAVQGIAEAIRRREVDADAYRAAAGGPVAWMTSSSDVCPCPGVECRKG